MYCKFVLSYFMFMVFIVNRGIANVTNEVSQKLITQDVAENLSLEENESEDSDSKPFELDNTLIIREYPSLRLSASSQYRPGNGYYNYKFPTEIYQAPLSKANGVKHRTTKTHPPKSNDQKKNGNKDKNNNKAPASKSSTKTAKSSKCTNSKKCSAETVKQQPAGCSSRNKCGQKKTKTTKSRTTTRRKCPATSSDSSDSSCSETDSESSETETGSSDSSSGDECCRGRKNKCCCADNSESESYSETESSSESETDESTEDSDISENSDSSEDSDSSDNKCCKHSCDSNSDYTDTENDSEGMPSEFDFEYTLNSLPNFTVDSDRVTLENSSFSSYSETDSIGNYEDDEAIISPVSDSNASSQISNDDIETNLLNVTEDSDVILIAVSPPMVYLNSTDSDSDISENEPPNEINSEQHYFENEYTINSSTSESDNLENMDSMHLDIVSVDYVNVRKARSAPISGRYHLEIPTTENNEGSSKKNLPLPEEEIKIMNSNGNFEQHLKSLNSRQHKNIGDFIDGTSTEKVSIKEKLDKIFQQINGTEYEREASVEIQTDLNNLEDNLKENPLWHRSLGKNAKYKEDMQIKEVRINRNLVIESPVSDWVGLNKKAVGRYHNRLILATADGDNFKVNNVEFAEAISAMFIFEMWNTETQSLDTILITARDARADWYNFTGENSLEPLWTWELMDPVSDIMVFQVYDQWKVLISYTTPITNGGDGQNGYSAIFGTELWKSWWLEQKFSCGGRPTISADSVFIAVPRREENNVIVYKYNGHKRTYEENKVIKSPGVTQVVAFTSGFNSFFALTGDNSGIYQIKSGSLVQKEIEQYYLGHVESWLPINLDYYTNDMVLMFQHKLDHYTHTSAVIEALKWNGENEKFELLEHQSCYTHQSEVHGFACIMEADGQNGIKGAAAVHFNNQPNILLASEQYTPLLFDISTKKVERIDPVQKEVLDIYHKLEELQKKFVTQKYTVDEAVKKLSSHNTRKIKGRNWTIEKLRASSINLIGNVEDFLTPDSSLTFGGKKWVENTPLSRYKTAIEGNAKRVKAILDKLKKAVKKSENMENIKAPFYFDGGLEVKGKVVAESADIKMLNNVHVDKVFKNVMQKSHDNMFHLEERKVDFLNVNNLVVSGTINGMSVSDISQGNTPIMIHDNLKLETHLEVIENIRLKGFINNIDVNKDIITIGGSGHSGTPNQIFNQYLKFSHLEAKNRFNIEGTMNGMKLEQESLRIQFDRNQDVSSKELEELTLLSADIGDLQVDSVNGIKWEEFEDNIVFKNTPTNLEELHVSGEVIALEDVAIDTLNKLAFPTDYVTKQEPSPITISGSKIFADELSAYSMDCTQVNGISLKNFVRLSIDQQLGNITFYDLSITEKLDIGGDIVGKDLHKILPNPLITETNVISSNMVFENLEVTGNVYVEKNINGTNCDKLASDLIYKSDDYAVIVGPKHFIGEATVKNGLNVTSGAINNLNIDDFITSDTIQYFKRDIILGNVRFDEVNVKGLFGNLNMTDLTENAVRTDANDQIIQGEVHFRSFDYSYEDYSARDVPEDPVQMNNLVVMKNCNGWRVPEDVVTSSKVQQNLNSVSTTFQHLLVKELIIDGDIITQHKVAGVDIGKFDTERFSLTRDQVITGLYEINNCSMEGDLNVRVINGVPSYDIIGAKQKVDNILKDVFTGRRVINNLHVTGNLMTNGINGVQLQSLAENAIWLNKKNHIPGKITFLEPIEVNKLQIDGDFGEVYFPEFIFNVVRKNDDPLELRGTVHFTNTLDITETLEVESINDMLAANMILKTNMEDIYNNVFVNGDIHVNNLNIDGHFNSIDLHNLQTMLSSSRKDEFHMNGNIQFQNGHRINNLRVNGSVNNYILKDVVDSLIWLHKDSSSSAEFIFRNPVTVLGNVQVNNLFNGIHLQSLFEDVVYINEDCKIDSNIVFDEPLLIGEILNIKDSISSDIINNFSMSKWRDSAIYLNRPEVLSGIHRMKDVTIEGNLNVDIFNKVNMNKIITLNTDQILVTDLHVETWEAKGNISVASLVNIRKLKDLYDNTLLIYGDQTILRPLVFRSNVTIIKNIDVKYINNLPIENIVTLNTDQNLFGHYIFDSAVTARNMQVGGKISQIDFDEWMNNAVFTNEDGVKTISGRWFIEGNVTIVDKMVGNEIIGGYNLTQIQKYLADTEKSIQKYENYLSSSYKQICNDFMNISRKLQDLSQFKDLPEIQSINAHSKFDVFYIEIKGNSYILIHYTEKCQTDVWQWMSLEERFDKISEILTGSVMHWNNIFVNEDEFISSKSFTNDFCNVKGINVWNFGDRYVEHKFSLPDVDNISTSEEHPTEILAENLGVVQRYKLVNKTGAMIPQKPNINLNGHTIHQIADSKYDITRIVIGNKEMWTRTLQNQIEIYEKSGSILQTIAINHPTSLTAIRLNNYHTLLAFIEDQKSVHTYTYKGLEMFKLANVLNLEADKLIAVKMRLQNSLRNFVIVSGKNFVKILKVITSNDISFMNMEYCNKI